MAQYGPLLLLSLAPVLALSLTQTRYPIASFQFHFSTSSLLLYSVFTICALLKGRGFGSGRGPDRAG